MGRGRQKAKATRQARDMKYYSPATDLSALERELGGGGRTDVPTRSEESYDEYDDYADKYTVHDEDDGEGRRRIG